MKGFLLDVNVLIALLWASHEHHAAAHRWFSRSAEQGWATCSLTQLGFVRIVSNPAFSADAVRIEQAVAVLQANLEHSRHRTWETRRGATELLAPFLPQLVGHRQITDAYLLGLAVEHGGRLATLDGGITALLPPDQLLADLVELLPTDSG